MKDVNLGTLPQLFMTTCTETQAPQTDGVARCVLDLCKNLFPWGDLEKVCIKGGQLESIVEILGQHKGDRKEPTLRGMGMVFLFAEYYRIF